MKRAMAPLPKRKATEEPLYGCFYCQDAGYVVRERHDRRSNGPAVFSKPCPECRLGDVIAPTWKAQQAKALARSPHSRPVNQMHKRSEEEPDDMKQLGSEPLFDQDDEQEEPPF